MRLRAVSAAVAAISVAVPSADAWAQTRKRPAAARPAAAAAPAAPVEPPYRQPPPPPPATALLAKCAAARAPEAEGKSRGRLRGVMTSIRSVGFDTFSISGDDGVFTCLPATAAKVQVERAPVDPSARNRVKALAEQADVRGDMRPSLFSMPQSQKRLQAMVDRIADAWPYPNGPRPKVLISANMPFNAEARVDNTLTVWLGVFEGENGEPANDLMDNDLYWLLGHEYAHLAMDHARRDEVMQGRLGTMRSAFSLYQRGVVFDARMNYAEPGATDEMRRKIEESKELHRNLRFVVEEVATPYWGRIQEDEADAIGFDLTALAGYVPRTDYAITRIGKGEKSMEDRFEAAAADMQKQMSATLADPRYQNAIQQSQFGAAAKTISGVALDSLWEGLKKQGVDWLKRKHRAADARAEGMDRYRATAYTRPQIAPTSEMTSVEVESITRLPELRRGLNAARAANQAQKFILAGDLVQARTAIAVALNQPQFSREAWVRFVAARIEMQDGRYGEAVEHLEVARRSPNAAPDVYRELARSYSKLGRTAAARPVIDEGKIKSGDPDFFLPEEIRILARSRQFKAMPPLLEACRRTEREELMFDCQHAAKDVDMSKLTADQVKEFENNSYFGVTPNSAKGDTARGQPTIPSLFEGLFSRP